MPALFAALEDRVSATVDRVFGESFEFLPMLAAPGGGRRSADPSRPVLSLTAVYDANLEKSTEFGSEARGSVPRSVQKPWVSIDAREFAGNARPQRLDQLRRSDTGDVYEIADVQLDEEGRYKLAVKHLRTEVD